MENATKALLIAGGVLIAIIIITLLVRTYGNISNFQRQQLTQEEARQIAEFNSGYTQYAGQYVYGTDVVTIINKTVNHNQQNTNINIEIEIAFLEGRGVELKTNEDKYSFVSEENVNQLRNRAFKCDEVEDSDSDGFVDFIKLTEKAYQVPGN